MACLDENVVAAYFDFRLGPDELHRLFAHVDACAGCASLLSETAAAHAAAGGEPTFNPAASSADTEPGVAGSPGPVEPAAVRDGEHCQVTQLGRYSIARTLGMGGMGMVYAGHDPQLDRKVAIKLLRPDVRGDPAIVRARLVREAQAMARLSHPNVISVFEVGSFGEQVFVVMELIDGVTLGAWLREKRRAWREIVRAFVAAGTGLMAAHRAGVIHRDFKPDNVLIAHDGRICVTDFGLARFERGDSEPAGGSASGAHPVEATVTCAGQLIGTPAYMAPEQMCGGATDARSDVFAFCVALYEALYGERPFGSGTMLALQQAIEAGRVSPPPDGARVPVWLRRALLRGLRANPEERWSSMDELLGTLDRDRRRTLRLGARAVGACAMVGLAVGLAIASASRAADVAVERPAEKLVAVLDLDNRSAAPEAAWLSTAIGELVAAELHAAGGPRAAPGDDVARMLRELQIVPAEPLTPDALRRMHDDLRVDFVVTGDYTAAANGGLTLTVRLVDAASGRELAVADGSGREDTIFELASRVGTHLRAGLGMPAATARERGIAQMSLPAQVEAARAYTRGLVRFRAGDTLEARRLFEDAVRLEPGHPFSHLMLARAWKGLGYLQPARDAAERAVELARGLGRDDQLSIEAFSRELHFEWDRAIDVSRALVTFFPDRADYWLRLAGVQARARRGKDCQATVDSLRQLPLPDVDDPSIDLAEARCAQVAADFPRARARAERAADQAARRGARLLSATALLAEGYALIHLGQLDRGLACYESARRTFHELGDRYSEARALNGQGIAYNERRDWAHARPLLEAALALYSDVGDRAGEMSAANNLANASDPTRARALYRRSAALAGEVHDLASLSLATLNQALLDATAGDVSGARRGLEEARATARQSGDGHNEGLATCNLCSILPRAGDLAAARVACDETERLWARTGEVTRQVELSIDRAGLFLEAGELGPAEAAARAGIAQAHALGVPASEAEAEVALAESLWRRGRVAAAGDAIERARALAAHAHEPGLDVTVAIAGARLEVASPRTRDWGAVARELSQLADEAKAGGWILEARDARLALGQALRNGHDARAHEVLAALADEARAAGDVMTVRKIAELGASRRTGP